MRTVSGKFLPWRSPWKRSAFLDILGVTQPSFLNEVANFAGDFGAVGRVFAAWTPEQGRKQVDITLGGAVLEVPGFPPLDGPFLPACKAASR